MTLVGQEPDDIQQRRQVSVILTRIQERLHLIMGNTLGMKEQLQHLLSQLREYPKLATGYAQHNQKKLLGETPDMVVAAMIRPGLLLQNRYRVVRQIGGGGFGKVFEVDDGGTPKVLKVLSLERFGSPTIKNKAIALFQREAQLLSKIQHPGIPRVEPCGYFTYPRDSSEPLHCLVMEKIPGSNLLEWLLARGNQPISIEQASDWLTQLVEILEQLHQKQYFHRDIKPSNIMLKPNGQLVLIDFGAVREVTASYLQKQNYDGTVIISPGYTPSEQAEGYAVLQSDFFALGRSFVYLLTGKIPLDFPKNPETGELIWRDQAPESPLVELIDRMMASFPGQRPKNCQQILDYLRHTQHNSHLRSLDWADTIPPDISGLPETKHSKEKLPKNRSVQFLLSFCLVLLGSINLWQSTPAMPFGHAASGIAFNLNNQGFAQYKHRSFGTANLYYRLALLFNPKMPEAQYNLGLLYEDQHEFELARAAYKIAVQEGFDRAFNNLARLYILDKQYTTAASLLQKGLPLAYDNKAKYAMLKNLGWAYLELGRYQEAQIYLQQAIDIKSDRAAAYCLQAKVLERQQNKQGALLAWAKCFKYFKLETREEQQRIAEAVKDSFEEAVLNSDPSSGKRAK